jgi:hypothetical protein
MGLPPFWAWGGGKGNAAVQAPDAVAVVYGGADI